MVTPTWWNLAEAPTADGERWRQSPTKVLDGQWESVASWQFWHLKRWAVGNMGAQISVEERSILNVLMHILKKRGIKYEERAVRTLLLCCKCNELPATAITAFDIETWEKAEKKLLEAASKGDQVATQYLMTWRLVKDSLAQLCVDKKAKAAAASAMDPETSPQPVSPSTFLVPHGTTTPPLLKGLNRLQENQSMLHQYLSLSLVIPHYLSLQWLTCLIRGVLGQDVHVVLIGPGHPSLLLLLSCLVSPQCL